MLQILRESPEIWQHPGFSHLILQPMSDSDRLRHWAEDSQLGHLQGRPGGRGGRLYELLHLTPSPGWKYPGGCWEVGG